MKKILIPTDFSDNAKHALQYALFLFGNENEFHLLNVYYASTPTIENVGEYYSIMAQNSEDDLEKLAEELTLITGDKSVVKVHSLYGQLTDCINQMVETHGIYSIVMGTKGASGLKELVLGSNAADVLHDTPVPVYAIPEHYTIKPLKRIAFGVDHPDISNLNLDYLLQLSKQFDAYIHFFTVFSDKLHEWDSMKQHLPQSFNYELSLIENTSIEKGVEEFVCDKQIDLLVVAPKKHTLLHRLFKASISKKIVMHLNQIPILGIHEK